MDIQQYKSISLAHYEFSPKFNAFVGLNGSGKTNLIDAIYYLCFTKSYFNSQESINVMHDKDFFSISGHFSIDGNMEHIVASVNKNQKVLKRNGKAYERLSEHIGLIPGVIITPYDSELIQEGSEVRRKFIDSIICQFDKKYLQALMEYKSLLQQRNQLLKQNFQNPSLSLFEVVDIQMERRANYLCEKRSQFAEQLATIAATKYNGIAHQEDVLAIDYKSDLDEGNLTYLLKNSLDKDARMQYTNKGVHKDDFIFKLNNYPIKKYGSQGQQKSYLIALKFAQYILIKNKLNKYPILMLDDIFGKLDDDRVMHLMDMVKQEDFGQVFITDTHPTKTRKIIENITDEYQQLDLSYEKA